MTQFRPMKAETADLAKLRFPMFAQPKLDGVRALNVNGQLRTRTLKPFANRFTQQLFSRPEFSGLDGEMWIHNELGDCSPSLCRDTTSALNTISGEPIIHWTIFDKSDLESSPYWVRYGKAYDQVKACLAQFPELSGRLHMVPSLVVYNHSGIESEETRYISQGYEGLILRQPDSLYRHGRSTVNSQELLRIKRFVDDEAVVTGLIEAQHNGNEAKISELGYLKRSSYSENKSGKGMIGALEILYRGQVETIGPGEMNHSDRIHFWQNPALIVGKLITFKHFPHGAKTRLRMASFKHIRENNI